MALSATPSTYIPKKLAPGQLALTTPTLLTGATVPASKAWKLTSILLINDTTSACTASIHLVPSGGSADDTNILIKAKACPTDGSPLIYSFREEVILDAGDTILGAASAVNQITYHVSYIELS